MSDISGGAGYGFARRPRWLLSHVFVIGLVAAMVALGLWQLNRLSERRESNDLIRERLNAEPAPLFSDGTEPGADLEYRRVVVAGSFQGPGVLVANRSRDGEPGFWAIDLFVVTPSETTNSVSGSASPVVLVNRGFVSRATVQNEAASRWAPPEGLVTLNGTVRRGVGDGRWSNDRRQITRPDTVAIAGELSETVDLDEYFIQVNGTGVAGEAVPDPLPPPDLGEGPHLSYAFQWFIFSVLGVVGYGLVLRKVARGNESRGDIAPAYHDLPIP